jgi:hypothetical protein
MFALTKFARLAAVGTVVIAAALSLPVRADDQPQNLGPVGPHEPILSPIGSKRVIAFYTPDSGHCGLRVVVWNPADVNATSTIGLRMSLIPQQVMYIVTPENGSLGLQCTDDAETLAVVQSDGVGLMH